MGKNTRFRELEQQMQGLQFQVVELGLHQQSGILGPPSSTTTNTDSPRAHTINLDFPRFASGDPTDWLFLVGRYFEYYQINDADRLLLASFHLDPPASRWFQGMTSNDLLPDWESFTQALQKRFGPTDDPVESLSKLTQTGSVLEYQKAFEYLSCRVQGISSVKLRSMYISGLKPKIRHAVLARRPVDVLDSFALARLFENQFADDEDDLDPLDEQTTPPPLQPEPDLTISYGAVFDNLVPPDATAVISYEAMFGCHHFPRPLLAGSISGHSVQILVDRRSSLNFLTTKMASHLGLTLHAISPFQVHVENGDVLICSGACHDVQLLSQSQSFSVDRLFVVDFKGADVVLGGQWLETLGTIVANFSNFTMSFTHNHNQIVLQNFFFRIF